MFSTASDVRCRWVLKKTLERPYPTFENKLFSIVWTVINLQIQLAAMKTDGHVAMFKMTLGGEIASSASGFVPESSFFQPVHNSVHFKTLCTFFFTFHVYIELEFFSPTAAPHCGARARIPRSFDKTSSNAIYFNALWDFSSETILSSK